MPLAAPNTTAICSFERLDQVEFRTGYRFDQTIEDGFVLTLSSEKSINETAYSYGVRRTGRAE